MSGAPEFGSGTGAVACHSPAGAPAGRTNCGRGRPRDYDSRGRLSHYHDRRQTAIAFASRVTASYKRGTKLTMANTSQRAPRGLLRLNHFLLVALALVATTLPLRAQLNFDVFIGHGLGLADSTVAEAAWFPVTCEVQNDGPSFNAIVEISGGQFGGGQIRRVVVELPTNTKKRFTIPMYGASRYRMSVSGKLFTERGKLIAEKTADARTVVDWQSPLLASLSRTHGGAAALPEGGRNSQLRPAATHLSAESFPDNPLALESIAMLYLHSARAAELKDAQAKALLAWLYGGGHLVVAVEQPGDVNSVKWLAAQLPCTLGEVTTRATHPELQEWLKAVKDHERMLRPRQGGGQQQQNPFLMLPDDGAFEAAPLPIVSATLRGDAATLIGSAGAPLALTASRGRGQITVLLFSPELEPFRSWRNKNWFWAKLGEVAPEWLASMNTGGSGSQSLDGVFGAMVDSKQIRKLPVGWLLLLLLAYLVVIGPLDQYWLKKINKQMLTWITFPTYVVLFSLLIYFIGYKLRSGEMEWNELHVVDVTPLGERADFRGRVFCSAYSPANARYPVASDETFSALRGEVSSSGAQEISKAVVRQRGNGFDADLTVPVWTSQLFVNDWWRQGAPPLKVTVTESRDSFQVNVENPLGKRIPQAQLIVDGRVFNLGDLTKGAQRNVSRNSGSLLPSVVQNQANNFAQIVQQRQSQFGGQGGHIDDVFNATVAVSFLGLAQTSGDPSQPWMQGYWNRFVTSRGVDLAPLMQRGDAILMAWLPDDTLVPTINKFTPRYSKKNTVLRVAVPVTQ